MSRSPTFTVLWSTFMEGKPAGPGCWATPELVWTTVNTAAANSPKAKVNIVAPVMLVSPSKGYRRFALLDIRNAGVVRRSRAGSGPEELAVGFNYADVVDAGLAAPHQAAFVELPLLIAVAAVPVAGVVVPLVL